MNIEIKNDKGYTIRMMTETKRTDLLPIGSVVKLDNGSDFTILGYNGDFDEMFYGGNRYEYVMRRESDKYVDVYAASQIERNVT
jgi:hypothetical protein